jgi:hypothetical protein
MVQVELHPSPEVVLPSSQPSVPTRTPSPQALAMHFPPAVGHVQPLSTWQVAEQPSLATAFPSSHVSLP